MDLTFILMMRLKINCDIICELWCNMVYLYSSFQRDWLRRDFNVIGFGLIGWLAPSSIPAIDGKSLTGLFFDSIGTELAHFPTPPALTSPFWLVILLTHLIFLSFLFYVHFHNHNNQWKWNHRKRINKHYRFLIWGVF